jgi:hypothetical protein
MDVLLMSFGSDFRAPSSSSAGDYDNCERKFPPLSMHTSVLTFSQHPRAGPYIGDVP